MALINLSTPSSLALRLLTVFLLLLSHSTAHFLLHYPATVGFDDDLEGQAPCGSFDVDFSKDNVTNFHVGGDSIALTSTHPMATWLFRATLDQTATKGNWTALLPAVSQSGLGSFCEQNSIMVPGSWAGQKGVISVVQDAADGLLYQCAAVSFVPGPAPSPPPSSVCSNATGLTASFTADAQLSALPATATAMSDSPSSSMSATGSATMSGMSTPSSTAAKSEAQMLRPFGCSVGVGEGAGAGGVWGLMMSLVTILGAVLAVGAL